MISYLDYTIFIQMVILFRKEWTIFNSNEHTQSYCHVLTSHASSKSRQLGSFWQLATILDINCPSLTDADTEDPLIIEHTAQTLIITRFCANGRKRLMKGLKYVFDYTEQINDPLGVQGSGLRRVIQALI